MIRRIFLHGLLTLGFFQLNAQVEYIPDVNTVLLLHMNETSGSAVSDASGNGFNRWRGGDQNQNVKIELLKGGNVVEVLGSPSNRGSFEWTVSAPLKPGKDYTLRLVNGRETVSSSTFAIKPKIPVWVKIGVPLVAVGVLLLPKSGSENSSSARLTAPPEILD